MRKIIKIAEMNRFSPAKLADKLQEQGIKVITIITHHTNMMNPEITLTQEMELHLDLDISDATDYSKLVNQGIKLLGGTEGVLIKTLTEAEWILEVEQRQSKLKEVI